MDVELTPTGYDNRVLPDVMLPLGDKPSNFEQKITNISIEPLSFSFKTANGVEYEVEASEDLRQWKNIWGVQGTGADYKFTVTSRTIGLEWCNSFSICFCIF